MTRTGEVGQFVFSLDTELAWGSVHHGSYASHESEFEKTRYAIDRILEMFERYEIRGTWAVVGKLMLGKSDQEPGLPDGDPSAGRNVQYEWRKDEDDDFWHGSDIVEKIRACSVPQEIGSHSYEHMIMGTSEATAERFDRDLKASNAIAEARNITPQSFIYPRNVVDHLDVLAGNGFTSYRGVAPTWTWRVPGKIGKRVARLADHFMPVAAPVVEATEENGIVNIPASYSYLHRAGWARYVPISVRVRKSILTMRNAARSVGIFHLWTHPFNIGSDPEGLLGGLERIFEEYKRLHDSGLIESRTMTEVADQVVKPSVAKAELTYASK